MSIQGIIGCFLAIIGLAIIFIGGGTSMIIVSFAGGTIICLGLVIGCVNTKDNKDHSK
jgi:hypothetical protein